LSGLCSPSSCPEALLPSVFHFGRPSASCAGSWSPGNGLGVEQRYNALMFGSEPSSLLVYIPLSVTLRPPLCFWCCASLRLEFTPMFGSFPHMAILSLYKAPMDSLVYCGCFLAGFPSLGFFLTIWSFPPFFLLRTIHRWSFGSDGATAFLYSWPSPHAAIDLSYNHGVRAVYPKASWIIGAEDKDETGLAVKSTLLLSELLNGWNGMRRLLI